MTFKPFIHKPFAKIIACTALAFVPISLAVPAQAQPDLRNLPPTATEVAAQTAVQAATQNAISVMPFETLVSGDSSGCSKRALFAISDETEWKRVWGVHTQGSNVSGVSERSANVPGAKLQDISAKSATAPKALVAATVPPLPKVDFSRQTVIAVLSGERRDGKSLQIAQIVRSPHETVAYYLLSDEKGLFAPAVGETTQPFHFVVIDTPTAPLKFVDVFSSSNCNKCSGG